MTFVVEMRGITKRFGALLANHQVDLEVASNEIHALLGENGAGKSTLMKILYGLYQPDEGTICIEGKKALLTSPADAIARGVGYVSQHFSLVPTFSVAENVLLGYEGGGTLSPARMNAVVAQTAQRYGFNIDPTAVVRDLSVGQQQRVEILKALYRNCRVLILDEPTAVLTPRDTQALFDILRELQQKDLSVIIITHKLDEVLAISQRVTVLRLGKVVGQAVTSETTAQKLARMMVGRDTVAVLRNTDHRAEKAVALDVDNLVLTDKRGVQVLRGVSFQVCAAEVVGIAGVAGNGQSELVSVLTGVAKPDSGGVRVGGEALRLGDPRDFQRLKVGRIPEDRLRGVVGDLSVAENLTMEYMDDYTKAGHLDHRRMTADATRLIEDFQIKATSADRVRTLSGGNIQKVILARTLSQQPTVVIAAQPTRGLDIGATEYVHQKLLEQKERGAAVLLVSEDLDEILLLSDRILVMYGGKIVGAFNADQIDMDKVSLAMTGAATNI